MRETSPGSKPDAVSWSNHLMRLASATEKNLKRKPTNICLKQCVIGIESFDSI